jgi:hypothetical protein
MPPYATLPRRHFRHFADAAISLAFITPIIFHIDAIFRCHYYAAAMFHIFIDIFPPFFALRFHAAGVSHFDCRFH